MENEINDEIINEEVDVRIGKMLTRNCIKNLFKVEPLMYPYPTMLQIKICNSPLKTVELYTIFSKLKNLFENRFSVVVLFISDLELQLIIGEQESIEKHRFGENTTDFVLKIC